MRKGFYFSFDAFLALTVISASLLVVGQSSDLSTDSIRSNQVSYRKSVFAGQDAMKLASSQTLEVLNDSFQNELVQKTVMEKKDLNRTVLDSISLLWAARNFSYAEEVSRRYFSRRLPENYGYRLQVSEGGTSTVIYNTSRGWKNSAAVSSISRLVSGHRIDRPSEGFQARARATSITKNSTKVVSIPAMGSANENGWLEVVKKFQMPDFQRKYYAYFYLNVEYNGDTMFEQLKVNGEQVKNDYTILQDNGDSVYARWNFTDELQEGMNRIYISVNGDASHEQPTELQPGSKLEVKYRKGERTPLRDSLRHKRIYFENMSSDAPGNTRSGIFKVESFEMPKDAEFVNASLHLNAKALDTDYTTWQGDEGCYDGWNVLVIFNGDTLDEACVNGDYEKEYQLSETGVENGTNIVTTYLDHYGNSFYGEGVTGIYSDFQTSNSSHIDLWYNLSQESLRFGEIRVSATEKFGGVKENPKEFQKKFKYTDLASSQVYIVERYSNEVELSVDDGTGFESVFRSPGVRATPTRVTVPPSYYDTSRTNEIRLYDYYKQKVSEEGSPDTVPEDMDGDGEPEDEDLVKFLPYSTFRWTVWADSQVGYGKVFENREKALKDARKRLESTLGRFVNATGIDTGTLSTGSQPYLWGPASVKLVVWRK